MENFVANSVNINKCIDLNKWIFLNTWKMALYFGKRIENIFVGKKNNVVEK